MKYIKTHEDFKGFISKLDYIHHHKLRVKQELENEFSKYVKTIKANLTNFGHRNDQVTIFLIDDDYGFIIEKANNGVEIFGAFIYITYKKDNYWTLIYSSQKVYIEGKESIENFVTKYVENLKKQNIKRIKNKEKRKLLKDTIKYNL